MTADKKRVLVIDDAALIRAYYRQALERAGYHVEEALNGLEGLEKLLMYAFDAVIVDINMPQMDGLTFLKLLRQKARPMASVPALVTSTESKAVDFVAARRAGANCYLVKPIDREVLLEYAGMLSGLAP